jgi:lysine-specific histone demethylase 1
MKLTAGEVFEAAAVVVTVPLGCLKAKDVKFDPPLPLWKAQAIDSLGFGDLNKVSNTHCVRCMDFWL